MYKTEYPPDLQAKINATISAHRAEAEEIPPEVHERPRFVHHPNAIPVVGEIIQIYCSSIPFPKGGLVLDSVGRAWRVEIQGHILIVHDPEDAWWDT